MSEATLKRTSRAETDSKSVKCSSLISSPDANAETNTVLAKATHVRFEMGFYDLLLTAAANLLVISIAMMPGWEMFGGGGIGGSNGCILITES
jgi:hypothetical protein